MLPMTPGSSAAAASASNLIAPPLIATRVAAMFAASAITKLPLVSSASDAPASDAAPIRIVESPVPVPVRARSRSASLDSRTNDPAPDSK